MDRINFLDEDRPIRIERTDERNNRRREGVIHDQPAESSYRNREDVIRRVFEAAQDQRRRNQNLSRVVLQRAREIHGVQND